MPTLTSPAAAPTSRPLLALLLAGATLAGATLLAAAQDRPRGGGPPPADHPQSEQRPNEQRQAPPGPGVLRLLPGDAVTQHTIEIAGGKLDYTATAGKPSALQPMGGHSAPQHFKASCPPNGAPD